MRMLLLAMGTVLWGVSSGTAEESTLSTLQLYQFCSSADATDKVACTGFLSGFILGLQLGSDPVLRKKMLGTTSGGKSFSFCLPGNLNADQVILILKKI